MSPAPVTDDSRLLSLSRAFDALLLTVHQLNCREKSLQQRLKYAHHEYLKLADQLPGSDVQGVSEEILAPANVPSPVNPADTIKDLAESGHLDDQTVAVISEGLDCKAQCPAGNPEKDSRNMEKDFTTNGTEGSLRCPFSNLNHNRDPDIEGVNGDLCGHGHVDPIKAELGDRQSSAPSGSQCPVSRCPIRFLDQHSPEEIADYVERHKHEIPRSHAVCVQRYGRNSQTMRRMDAKYGGLTNMITGLGEKHQAFLPGHQNGAPSSGDWADDPKEVHSKGAEEGGEEGEREEREGHFDRPLREVRVGESPSRPWGIPVPITADPVSAPHSQAAPVPGSDEKVDGPGSSAEPFHNSTKGCPFGHGHGAKQNPETETVREGRGADQPAPEDGDSKPGVVFNGPVFFGYTAEQTAGFLQQLSSSIP